MKVEFHIVQSFPPSCLNRDDTNTPKDCMFGGVRRARVSSQSWKRAIRMGFQNESALHDTLAMRTKRVLEAVKAELISLGRDADGLEQVIKAALGAGGLKTKGDTVLTEYLLFLPKRAAAAIAAVIHENFDAISAAAGEAGGEGAEKGRKKAKSDAKELNVAPEIVKALNAALFESDKTPELALFGRMIADDPSKNVDAAAQVAHAISTNAAAPEFDFYTAVDDLKTREDDAGADMLGTIGFVAPCFYRYATVDTDQLAANLGGGSATGESRALAAETIGAFARGMIGAIPSARQNSMAAHTPPSFILVVVRSAGSPVSLANAFEKEVRPGEGLGVVGRSIERMARHWDTLCNALGTDDIVRAGYVVLTDDVPGKLEESISGSSAPIQRDASVSSLIEATVRALGGGSR